MDIKEVRAKYPQYQDLSDDQLGRALHQKFYSDMPYEAFAAKTGIRPEKPLKLGAERLPEDIAETAKGFSAPSKFAIGAAGAINDAAMRLKQLVTGKLAPQDEQGVKEYRALNQASPSALAGDVGMNLLATATPGMALQSGLTNVAAKVAPRFIAPTLGAAGAGAGMAAATEPVLQGESTADKAMMGAVGGAVGDVAARGIARVAQPIQQSQAVKTLLKEGVVPTPGQAAGSKSFIGRFEQRLESLPILGDIITRGRTRSIEELNRAAVNASLPQKAQIHSVGRKAIEEAQDIFNNAYRTALSGKEVPLNASNVKSIVQAVKSDPDVFLTKAAEENLERVAEQLTRRLPPSGKLSGEAAKSADSWLGGLAATYNRSPNASDRELGSAVLGIQRELRGELAKVIPELKGIDSKYAAFLRVQRAAGATGSRDGIFSPEALQQAVRSMDKSRGGFAGGKSVMQNISDPAVDVLGRSVADSGTAGRALVGAGLLGAGGAANEYYGGPGFLTALALAPALYSRAGSRYLIGDYAGQSTLADLARRAAPYAAQLGRAGAN